MKKLFIFVFVLILALCIPHNVQAFQDGDTNNDNIDSTQIESLYNYIANMKTKYEILKDLNVKDFVNSMIKSGDGKVSLKKISEGLTEYAFREVLASLKIMGVLISICIVCALINNLQSAFSNESLSDIAYFACYALLIVVLAKSFYVGIDIAKTTITQISDFMIAIIPVLITLLVSLGGFSEAMVMDPFIIGTITICTRIYVNVIIPVILMSFVLQFINNISKEYKINNLTKLMKQAAIWMQGIMMTIFIGILTIRGITSKTIDVVTVKTAKYAIDNFVPIVGKSLSDAISTVAGYSMLLKNALSILGLIIIVAIILNPIIKLLIIALSFKVTSALIEPISDKRLVDSISAAGDSVTLILSCVISVSVMFFIMIAILGSAGRMAMG